MRRGRSVHGSSYGVGVGLLAGALTAYFFDPERGRKRRTLAKDAASDLGHRLELEIEARAQRLGDRARRALVRLRAARARRRPSVRRAEPPLFIETEEPLN